MEKLALLVLTGLLSFTFALGVSAQTPDLDPFPPEVESCLRAAFGDERFDAISSGQAQPTPEEMSRGEHCFEVYPDIASTPPPDAAPPPDMEMSQELIDCLKNAVGEERFNAISSGQAQPTPEEMNKGEECFQEHSGIIVQPPPQPPDSPTPGDITMSPELIDCLKSVIGGERFEAISSGQAQPTPEEMSRGEQCFQGYGGTDHDAPPGASEAHPSMDPWLEACLRDAVGDERFDAISSGQSQPTDVEEQEGIACFARLGHEPPTVVSAPGHEVETEVLQCLKLALGEERFKAISEGAASPTLAEREKAERCFGSTPAPISPPPHVVLDETLIACLKAAVGEERFQAIKSGESLPTPEERAKGEACFQDAQPDDVVSPQAILPLPSEQIPYLSENADAISVDEVSAGQDSGSEAAPSSEDTEATTLEGTAPPGEIVDIYIHSSTVIVASTEADSSGRWSYTVLGLEEGPHLAYATAKISGQTERSEAKTFQAGDAESAGPAPVDHQDTPSTTARGTDWTRWVVVLGAVGLILLAVGVAYPLLKRRGSTK